MTSVQWPPSTHIAGAAQLCASRNHGVLALLIFRTPAGASTSLVLDAELVAVDRENNNRLKAFQELSTRARGAITAAEARTSPSHRV